LNDQAAVVAIEHSLWPRYTDFTARAIRFAEYWATAVMSPKCPSSRDQLVAFRRLSL
jgi:hypothetical protein